MEHEIHLPEDDPPRLGHADRDIRIDKLRRKIEEAAGCEMISGAAPDCDPELEAAFLKQVLELEKQEAVSPFDLLVLDGVDLPPPEKLDEVAVTAKLWELIRALASRRCFLERTDHLSDRELYAWLHGKALREELMEFELPFADLHFDALGGFSEEDMILQMRYYADEFERAGWADEDPDFPMPPSEKPPYDRDRHLPQQQRH